MVYLKLWMFFKKRNGILKREMEFYKELFLRFVVLLFIG